MRFEFRSLSDLNRRLAPSVLRDKLSVMGDTLRPSWQSELSEADPDGH